MNSVQSIKHILSQIISQSKQRIQQNKLIKRSFIPYSTQKFIKLKSNMLNQTGIQQDISNSIQLREQQKNQQKPQTSQKDKNSFFSVKKIQNEKKENTFVSMTKENLNHKNKKNRFFSLKNSNKIKSSSFSINQNTAYTKNTTNQKQKQKQKQQKVNNFFVLQEQNKNKLTKLEQRQQKQIDKLRNRINQRQQCNKRQKQQQKKDQQMKIQRQQKLTNYLQNHISKPKSQFTFDIQGQMLLYTSNNFYKKEYPKRIKYDIYNQQQHNFRSKKNRSSNRYDKHTSQLDFSRSQNHKLQGARGQIFKSSVLKTINMSRISLGNPIDQHQFMKRNDLFNNNHCRQTTSIPFIQLEDGISFKETGTNLKVSGSNRQSENSTKMDKKAQAQARARSQFIKYSSKNSSYYSQYNKAFFNNPQKKMNTLEMDQNNKDKNVKMRSTHSGSFNYKRPQTTQIGKIKRQNQQLYLSMFS